MPAALAAKTAERRAGMRPPETEPAQPSEAGPDLGARAGMPAFLQRKGTHGSSDDEKEDLLDAEALPKSIQSKVVIGAPDSPEEREADAVAQLATSASAPVVQAPQITQGDENELLQRACSCGDCAACRKRQDEIPPLQRSAVRSERADSLHAPISQHPTDPGHPLSEPVRNRIEPLLGTDLGHVRVHTDTTARATAAQLHAKAFTHQNHIWVGPDQSAEDLHLMAHEATHVVQPAEPGMIHRKEDDDDDGDATCAGINEAAQDTAVDVYDALDGWNDESSAIAALEGHAASRREDIQLAFECLYDQSLRSYLREQVSEDWLVQAFALLHAAHTHDPQTQMGLALIPHGTRDEEVFRLLNTRDVRFRQLLELGYDLYFGQAGNDKEHIGEGSLKKDLKEDLSGWRKEKALALLDRNLTDADELYFDSKAIAGTHTDAVVSRIQDAWARGPQAFLQMERDWDDYVRNRRGWTDERWHDDDLRQTMDWELSGEAWELVKAVLDNVDAFRRGVGVEVGPLSPEQENLAEELRMKVAEASLIAATTGGLTGAGTNEEQVYAAVSSLRATHRARIDRLRASGDEKGALDAEQAWEARHGLLKTELKAEMNVGTAAYAHARLVALGDLTDADEIWLAGKAFNSAQVVSLVTRTWAKGGVDRLLQDARTPRLDGKTEVRPSFDPNFMVPVTSGTPWHRIHALVRKDRDDAQRGAARLDIELSEGRSDSDLEKVFALLTTPDLSPELRSATIARYVSDHLRGGDSEQTPDTRFVACVQKRYENSPTTYEIQDLLTPAATIEEMVERAEGRMRSVHSGVLSMVLDDWMRDYDAITAEDTEAVASQSLERLRYIRDHQHDESGEIDAMLALNGVADATELAKMEYGLFRERLAEVRAIRRAIVEGVMTAIQIAIEIAATALTGGAALPMLIASLSATIATMVARELLLGENYELFSAENAKQIALVIASHGAAAGRSLFAVSPEKLAQMSRAQAFFLNAAQDGFTAMGTQMVAASIENRMPSGDDLAAGVLVILGSSIAGGTRASITHGLSEHAGELERLRTLVTGQIVQNVVASNAEEGAAMLRQGGIGNLSGGEMAGRFLGSTGLGMAKGVGFGVAEFHATQPAPAAGTEEESKERPDAEADEESQKEKQKESQEPVSAGGGEGVPEPKPEPAGETLIDRREAQWRGLTALQRDEFTGQVRRGRVSIEDLETLAISRAQGDDVPWGQMVSLVRRLPPEELARLATLLHEQDLPLHRADVERFNMALKAGAPIRPLVEELYNVRPALHAETSGAGEDPEVPSYTGRAATEARVGTSEALGKQGGEEWAAKRGIMLDAPLDPRAHSEPHGHGFDGTGSDAKGRRVILEWKGETADLSTGNPRTGLPPQMSSEWVGRKLAEMHALGVEVQPFLDALDKGRLVGYAVRTSTWSDGSTHIRTLPGYDGMVYDPVRVRAAMAERHALLLRPVGRPADAPDRTRAEIQQSLLTPPVRRPQRKKAAGAEAGEQDSLGAIHAVARGGLESASEPLPHLDRIQASFGDHDLRGIKAQIGGPAAKANDELGSVGYTFGDRVGFSSTPDVRLAAHEAAHVIQQRAGIPLEDGVDRPGDEFERDADRVADAVVRGERAEPDAGARAGTPAYLQRQVAPADVRAGTNPMNIVDRLVSATEPKVNFAAVMAALGGLTPAEALLIRVAYIGRRLRPLDSNLFAYDSGLTQDQRVQVHERLYPGAVPANVAGFSEAQAGGPADVNVGFSPRDILHRLLEAIDQSQYNPFLEKRHVEFAAVLSVLSGLTAGQVQMVEREYYVHEGRSLGYDLFEGGESGYPSDLTADQRTRIKALLGGTAATQSAPEKEKQEAASHQRTADAVELHGLLHGRLGRTELERVMDVLRRSAGNNALGEAYERLYQVALVKDLSRLGIGHAHRARVLLQGDVVQADSLKVGGARLQVEMVDRKIYNLKKEAQVFAYIEIEQLQKERKRLVAEIEQVTQRAADEARSRAIAQGEGAAAGDLAARSGAVAVLGDVEKVASTVRGADADVIRALATDDPVARVAAQLRRSSAAGTLKGSEMTAALRGLREEAETRARAEAHAKANEDIAAGREPSAASEDEIAARARTLADDYFRRLADTYNALSVVAFDRLVETTGDETDAELNRRLVAGSGQLDPVVELVLALRGGRKDLEAVKRVLHGKSRKEIEWLKLMYFARTFRTLDHDLFGKAPTQAGGENPEMIGRYLKYQGKASGSDRLTLEDYMQRPWEEGGLEEVEYISRRAEREYDYTIANRGATGWWRDNWGNEARNLLDETIKEVRALKDEYVLLSGSKPDFAGSAEALRLIWGMRRARATIRGDRAAYEKANAELRAALEFVASIAIQAALTAALGPAFLALSNVARGGAVAARIAAWAGKAALSTATNIAANATVYDYSLDMFKNDVLGGFGGALGVSAADKLLGAAASGLVARLGPKCPRSIVAFEERMRAVAAGTAKGYLVQDEIVAIVKTLGGAEGAALVQSGSLTGDFAEIAKMHVIGKASDVGTHLVGKAGGKVLGATPKPAYGAGANEVPAAHGEPVPSKQPQAPISELPLLPAGDMPQSTAAPSKAPSGKKATTGDPALDAEIDRAIDKFAEGGGGGGGKQPTGSEPRGEFGAGPVVRVPLNIDPANLAKLPEPARVLEVGAGSRPTDLGVPSDPNLVQVVRSDILEAPHVDIQFDATQAPPPALHGTMNTVLINNPRGYSPNIAELMPVLEPGGRIIVQGRGRIGLPSPKNMRGFNPDFQRLIDEPPPPGVKKTVLLDEGGLPADPANTSRQIMGGPFYRTEGDAQVWPNARVIFERIRGATGATEGVTPHPATRQPVVEYAPPRRAAAQPPGSDASRTASFGGRDETTIKARISELGEGLAAEGRPGFSDLPSVRAVKAALERGHTDLADELLFDIEVAIHNQRLFESWRGDAREEVSGAQRESTASPEIHGREEMRASRLRPDDPVWSARAAGMEGGSSYGRAAERMGDAFLENHLNNVVSQVQIYPILDNGQTAPWYFIADNLGRGRADGRIMAFDTKLTSGAPYTAPQLTGYPLLGRNGGVIRSRGLEGEGYPNGLQLEATSTFRLQPRFNIRPRASAPDIDFAGVQPTRDFFRLKQEF